MFATMSVTTHGAIQKVEERYNEFKKLCDELQIDIQNAIKHAKEPQLREICRVQIGRQLQKATLAEAAMTEAIELALERMLKNWNNKSLIESVEAKRKKAKEDFDQLRIDAKALKVKWGTILELKKEFDK